MLSPADEYKKVPKAVPDNLAFRKHVLLQARDSKTHQSRLYEACRNDVLFYASTFVWGFDPRKISDPTEPIVPYPFQEAAVLGSKRTGYGGPDRPRKYGILECIEDQRDLVIEKSRDMGASWFCLIVLDWLARFHPGMKFLCVSRDEKMVESDNADSLFWKLDHVHKMLPAWLKDDDRRIRTKGMIGYRRSGSQLTGVSTTKKSGVGGRATAALLDEFSQMAFARQILDRTADTTNCRIFNFTHVGTDTEAFALTQRPDVRKLVLHWSEHPSKSRGLYRSLPQPELIDTSFKGPVPVGESEADFPDQYPFDTSGHPTGGAKPSLRSPWYDFECARRDNPRAVAIDLDINPTGSMVQFFDPGVLSDLIRNSTSPPVWRGDLHHDPDTGRPIALVESPTGPLQLWVRPTGECSVPPGRYAAGADISWGSGATPSTLSVASRTGEKVAQYANAFIEPKPFASLAVAVCHLFGHPEDGPAKFAWEMNGPGKPFGRQVLDIGFRNVFYRTFNMGVNRKGSDLPGWYPSPESISLLLSDYRAALQSRRYHNPCKEALEECYHYRHEGGTVKHALMDAGDDPSGQGVNHGDRVLGDALTWMLIKDWVERPMPGVKTAPPEEDARSLAGRRRMAELAKDQQNFPW